MFEHHYLQNFGLKLNKYGFNMGNFQVLEVLGHGSETQLQVAENLN